MTGYMDKRTTAAPSVTRADVLDAALTLFAERGYHGTSLKQVAQQLDIRTPSLYNHMESKASLLSEIVLGTLERVVVDLEQVIADVEDPIELLRQATEVYALHHATHPREALVVNQDSSSLDEPDRSEAQRIRRENERAFRQIIIDGKEAGVLAVESPKLASFAIREMCVSIARWYQEGGELTADEVARQYSDYALRVVGAERVDAGRGKSRQRRAAAR